MTVKVVAANHSTGLV